MSYLLPSHPNHSTEPRFQRLSAYTQILCSLSSTLSTMPHQELMIGHRSRLCFRVLIRDETELTGPVVGQSDGGRARASSGKLDGAGGLERNPTDLEIDELLVQIETLPIEIESDAAFHGLMFQTDLWLQRRNCFGFPSNAIAWLSR